MLNFNLFRVWLLAAICCSWTFVGAAALTARADEADGSSEAARAAYASAAAFQNRDAWDLAAEEWVALIKNHPQDPLAKKGRYYLGICQLKNDQWAEAAKTFREVIAGNPDAQTAALARWELGRGEFQLAQTQAKPESYAIAAKSLGDFVEKSPGKPQLPDALFFLGESLWQAGNRDKAIETWQKLIRDHATSPRLPEVLYSLGIGQAEMKKFKEASATLKRFADAYPTHKLFVDVALWRADIAISLNAPAEAEQVLAPLAVGKGPRVADALERLGNARWSQRNWVGSAAAFGQLADDFPTSPQAERAALSAGMALIEAKQPDQARPRLEKVIALSGARAVEAGHRLAIIELDARHFPRALEIATKALDTLSKQAPKPDSGNDRLLAKLQLDRADALWEITGKRVEAAAAYAAILEKHPEDPVAKTALSMTALHLLEQGKAVESIAQADRFLKKYPPAAGSADEAIIDVKTIRAEALLVKGDNAGAAAAYHELVAAHPQAAQLATWQSREGAALIADKHWQKAHDVLAAALPKLKDSAAAEAMLLDATCFVELKNPAEAVKVLASLEAAHPQWPRRSEGMLLAVRAKREAGDKAGALKQAEQLVLQFPSGPLADVAWYRLGQLRQDAGTVDTAIEAYAQARTLKPKGNRAPWALLASGWCHEAKGRLPEAIKVWSDLIDSYPESSALGAGLLARGDARQRSGDFKGGQTDAQRLLAIQQDPKTKLEPVTLAEARLISGLCLSGDKQFAAAAIVYQQLLADQPNFPAADRVLYALGLVHLQDNKRAEAEASFRKLVERFPNSNRAAEAWLEIGEAKWETAAAADRAAKDRVARASDGQKGLWDDAAKAYLSAINSESAAIPPVVKPEPAVKPGTAPRSGKSAPALLEQARHKLGWTFVMRNDNASAIKAFADQLAQHPTGPLAADGQALLGEALFNSGKFAEAQTALAQALKDPAKLSSAELRGMASLRAIECTAQQEKWADSLTLAEQFLSLTPQSPSVPEVRYAAAWAQQNLGQLDKALEGYRSVADASRSELAARARLMEGEVLFEQNKHKDAVKSFFKVAYGFGEKLAPPAYHPWQAQATFEAARCFEVLEKSDQARKLYAELVERYPDSQQTPAARKRLQSLGPTPASTPEPEKKAS